MTRIAFLGLGAMGTPLARRLLATGHDVTVWNRSPARAEALLADGATVAATPAEAVTGAAFVLTMLSDAAAVESVVAAFAPALEPGAVVVEMSTIGPEAEFRVRDLLPDSVALADAPVMGSVDRAATGSLTVLAGGAVEEARPVLSELGDVVDCGAFGAGAGRKLVLINAVIAGVAVVGEALALADRLGVTGAREALAASPLGPLVGRAFAEGVDFSVEMAAKDLGIATGAVDLPVLAAARAQLLAVPDQDADLGAVVASIRGRAGEG